jgi:short-subunit dehydrogenase
MNSLNPKIVDWRDLRVWVIGASSGIGAALTNSLSQLGARLAVSARRESALRSLVDASEHLVLPLDATCEEEFSDARAQLLRQWGGVDMVFYCAGTYTPMRAVDMELNTVQKTLSVNLNGAYNLLNAIVPLLTTTRSGGICMVASVAGYTGLPKALAYGPSKAALINLTQILYTELSSRGIGVYLVNPGFVATRLTEQNDFRMPALITPEEAAKEIIRGIGKGRFEIHFPRRFTLLMKCLSTLPDRLRFALLRKSGES